MLKNDSQIGQAKNLTIIFSQNHEKMMTKQQILHLDLSQNQKSPAHQLCAGDFL